MEGIVTLLLSAFVVSATILTLFHHKDRLGMGPLFVLVGSQQYLQALLAETLRLTIPFGLQASPGSAVLFASSLLIVLLTYIEEDANSTRALILGTLVANLLATLFTVFTGRGMLEPWLFLWGSFLFAVDAVLLLVIYEGSMRKLKASPALAAWVAIYGVLAFDSAAFSVAVAPRGEFLDRFAGDLAGKLLGGSVYALGFSAYVQRRHLSSLLKRETRNTGAVLGMLSYRQRYEIARDRAAELQSALDHKRLQELVTQEREARLKEELRATRAAAELGQFVAGVAHEVRNPLFGIQANLEAWAHDPRAGFATYGFHIRNETERLQKLMNDLLLLGRPSVALTSRAGLASVIDSALSACRRAAEEKEVRIRRILQYLDASIDSNRVEQAVRNLVENAIQHSPSGADIEVSCREQEGFARIEVSDQGHGIPEADLSRVFDVFFSRRQHGTGLGLAIVARVAAEHGGVHWARNRPGGGAVVGFSLSMTSLS